MAKEKPLTDEERQKILAEIKELQRKMIARSGTIKRFECSGKTCRECTEICAYRPEY